MNATITSGWMSKNIFVAMFLSLLLSAQCLAALAVVFSFMGGTPALDVFPEWQFMVRSEKETLLWLIWIVCAVLFHIWIIWFYREIFSADSLWHRLRLYICVECVLTALIYAGWFKVVVYAYHPELARTFLCVMLALSLAVKIFWPDLLKAVCRLRAMGTSHVFQSLSRWLPWALGIFIFFVLFIPDYEAVVARMFIGEQFHHWESFMMSPGWAHLKGQILNVDVRSGYGLGLPIILSRISRVFGEYSYPNMFLTVMWLCILYYLAWFALLNKLYKSSVLAAAIILCGIRVQMFHVGIFPFVFTYPSTLVIRVLFDVVFFWLLYRHVQSGGRWVLALMGCACGVALFYITSTGVYMTAAYMFYLGFRALLLMKDNWSLWWRCTGSVAVFSVIPFCVAFGLMWIVQGKHLLDPGYWRNMSEFIEYFLCGWGLEPMTSSLRMQKFLASFVGFSIPLVYVGSLIILSSMLWFRRVSAQVIFWIVLCVYGLGTYHYYIARSAESSYYCVGLPFVFIFGYWMCVWLQTLSAGRQKAVVWILMAIFTLGLFTNYNYVSYPNVFNISKNPVVDPRVAPPLPNGKPYFMHLFYEYPEAFKLPRNSLGERDEKIRTEVDFKTHEDLKAYFRQEFDFPEDAGLIRSLTQPDEAVALISSFDTKILMQSDRKAFFYHALLLDSRPMTMRMFTTTHIATKPQLKRTLDRLEKEQPPYIFMETIFLTRPVPQAYYYESPGLMPLLDYVLTHYAPHKKGKYLTAMKRK